jgi:hydrogenase maturation factor
MTDEKKVTLRPKEQVQKARTGEIIRAMRDAAEGGQVADPEWVSELAELVDVDIRKR